MTAARQPRYELFDDPHVVKRIRTTVSSSDADDLQRVEGAGDVFVGPDGVEVQRMHNGLLVEAGGYDGPWMTEIIRSLAGVHEPQEERAFSRILERLSEQEPRSPRMIEFGSYWSYYSLWFLSTFAEGRAIGLEPDEHNLGVGQRNAALNGMTERIRFVHGAIGDDREHPVLIARESDGRMVEVDQYDLARLMELEGWEHVDVVLADVQGFETPLLELSRPLLEAGAVRFLVVSTHHNSISGSALTHQRALADLQAMGAHIIAEHSIPESFSGDGLIAASFDPRDADLNVPVTFARSRDSLFDDVEWELDRALRARDELQHELEVSQNRAVELERAIDAIHDSHSWRLTRPIRWATGALRRNRSA